MIRCNLAILLAERSLKITKVSLDTGISRTTLTSLANNACQGIQLDTMNTLCLYLETTPDKLFSFCPVDINVLSVKFNGEKDGNSVYEILFNYYEYKKYNEVTILSYWKVISKDQFLLSINVEKHHVLNNLINKLPKYFLSDIEEKIIISGFPKHNKDDIVIDWEYFECPF